MINAIPANPIRAVAKCRFRKYKLSPSSCDPKTKLALKTLIVPTRNSRMVTNPSPSNGLAQIRIPMPLRDLASDSGIGRYLPDIVETGFTITNGQTGRVKF